MTKLMKDLFNEEMEDFHYERQELPKGNINLRSGICDVVMKSKKRYIILEVQNKDLKNLVERVKYYASGFYSNQNPGKDYKMLLPVEVFLILNFPFGEPQVLKEYEEFEKDLREQLGNLSKIKIWNIQEGLNKKQGLDYDYARLFTLDDEGAKEKGEVVLEELEKNDNFKELVKEIRYYNLDEETYKKLKEAEFMEMTFEQATAGFFRDGMEKGKLQGIELGKQQGLELGEQYGLEIGFRDGERKKQRQIVQNMLREGFSMEQIEKAVELKKEEILKLIPN